MSANGTDQIGGGGSTDLTDLVDFPRETLEIELKQWIDLRDRVAQAKFARHIAALANHGGGWIVFGFCDNGTIDPDRPAELSLYSRDTFGSIGTRLCAWNDQEMRASCSFRGERRLTGIAAL